MRKWECVIFKNQSIFFLIILTGNNYFAVQTLLYKATNVVTERYFKQFVCMILLITRYDPTTNTKSQSMSFLKISQKSLIYDSINRSTFNRYI